MAIYVTSDAHGHVRALDEALSKISLTSDDTLYVLGDMIDRGPDPVGVINLVRSLPNARVLKGNHEQIMLDAIIGQDPLDAETWDINGGWTTRQQLNEMEFEAYEGWCAGLPPCRSTRWSRLPSDRICWCTPAFRPRRRVRFCLSMVSIAATAGERSMPIASCCSKCSPCSRPMTCCGFVTATGMPRRGCFLPRARARSW